MRTLLFILLFLLIVTTKAGTPKVYRYIDGNGNKFDLTEQKGGAMLEYFPMSPEFSLSGTYNGGEPWKVTISEEDFKYLVNLLKAASKDESQQSADRNLGGATILLPNTRNKDFYLKMDAAYKTIIENKFKELKTKYRK